MVEAANSIKNFFKSISMIDNKYTLYEHIHLIGGHPSPFPFIAVTLANNKVVVMHGIWHLTFIFDAMHLQEGEPIAFIQDTVKEPPRIFKLDKTDFEDAKEWPHPSITEVMSKDPTGQEIIPIHDTSKTSKTSKIILIPISSVLLLMNEGQSKTPMKMFHQFYDTFWEQVSPQLKEHTQHIFDFLLVATGFDEDYDGNNPPIS